MRVIKQKGFSGNKFTECSLEDAVESSASPYDIYGSGDLERMRDEISTLRNFVARLVVCVADNGGVTIDQLQNLLRSEFTVEAVPGDTIDLSDVEK